MSDYVVNELSEALLDGWVALCAEVALLPPSEQEEAALFKFRILEELVVIQRGAEEIRARALSRARETQGDAFVAWVAGLMARCAQRVEADAPVRARG